MEERQHHEPSPPRAPLWARLFGPVDIASLVCFRVAFGVLMMAEVVRYIPRIARYYIDPPLHFSYYGFEWVRPWAGDGMYVHFGVLGLAALCITIGLCYRLAAAVFFLGFSYMFLLEQARYLNHIYLLCLIAFIMIFVPAHRAFSVDAWLRPKLRRDTAPKWALRLVQLQIGIPYVYGGLAKLNPDWLRGEPMRMWLAERADRPIVGPLMTQEWVVYFFSYGGLLFDLFIVPAMLWRRTRPWAFVAALGFHFINGNIFTIGIFPWVMAAATLMYFPPDWPRRFRDLLGRLLRLPPAAAKPALPPAPLPTRLGRGQKCLLTFLGVYTAWQLLFPLRHWLYPGDVAWTEEGHKFSWRMKLRDKGGSVAYHATDPTTGESWKIDLRGKIKRWQLSEMTGRPEMILQLAHYLGEQLRAEGIPDVEIRALAPVSLNGREPEFLIDPEVDLMKVERSLLPATWIRPEAPLEPAAEARLSEM
ncbi:HTTM domain-containing protein [Nannocystis bainbridge]|uniref:HTTM domain-containing protein n=1 Tax=Nannocystis bainbridge TaxID=2995303 RepID=A0ABT5E9X2_9BACT|nr:HTTM domain-containing protein [Nannocystis bainbridge]MDC0722248.1 HTTM domain-containing protein [Nannocystis bainbridge]